DHNPTNCYLTVTTRIVFEAGGLMSYGTSLTDTSPGWYLYRPDSQRREGRRPTDLAADQVRVCDQPQHPQDIRPRHPAAAARDRRRGDRMSDTASTHRAGLQV